MKIKHGQKFVLRSSRVIRSVGYYQDPAGRFDGRWCIKDQKGEPYWVGSKAQVESYIERTNIFVPVNKYRVRVYWEMCGEVEVYAPNISEAHLKAVDCALTEIEQADYVPDSINVDPDVDIQQIS